MYKRGISAVVATVLIILMTVATVTILWGVIIPIIKGNLEFSALDGRVDVVTSRGYTFYDDVNKKMSVQIKRSTDNTVMNHIKVFFSVDGDSFGIPVESPEPGNTRVYVFDLSRRGEPDSVSVAPIFTIGNKEKEGPITSNIKSSGLSNSVLAPSANLKLVVPGSIIDSDSWEAGSGSAPGYSQNGATSENAREYGIGPHGDNVLLWKGGNDASSNADGGWNSALIPIDHTKTYRSTIWIKKTGSNTGSTYFGCYGPSTNRLNGDDWNNPYYWVGDLPELNKWYLIVAYIHGSGDPSIESYGGIYDGVTGEKVRPITDAKNKDGVATQRHRAYLYYDITTTNRQYFWNPTFTEVSSYELPIEIS